MTNNKSILILPIITLLVTFATAQPFISSGSKDVDEVRKALLSNPTNKANYRERTVLLFSWVAILQQQKADLRPFFDIDEAYYELEMQTLRGSEDQRSKKIAELAEVIDNGFQKLEEIYTDLKEKGPMFSAKTGDPNNFPAGGDMDMDWPMFQGNKNNTGHTTAPGPKTGENKWKFPIALGWYSRPVVESQRVYIASPGMYATSFCLDLNTGDEIWKSTQTHPLFGIYKFPAIASTPVIQGDRILLREVNSHGGNKGQAKNIVYIDKKTGKTLDRKYAGHVDYRTQNAPVAANDKFTVYPFGLADIYGAPAICQNYDRLICADKDNNRKLWEFNVGDIDAIAEPVMSGNRVFQGTMEGYLYALNLDASYRAATDEVDLSGESERRRIAWNFQAKGSINTQVSIENKKVYFGANDGHIYCLDENSGKLVWKKQLEESSETTRKQFSTISIDGDQIYLGSTGNTFYALDASKGTINWSVKTADWIRAKPAYDEKQVYVADLSGNFYAFNKNKKAQQWKKQVSTHPIYADLTYSSGKILLNDSDLYTHCLDKKGTLIWKRSILSAQYTNEGQRILNDQLSGGTYYQSKPTAADGSVYFGTPSGFLYSVDAETGKENWKFEMGAAISVGPAIADGKIYVGQQGGERFFYCVNAKDGSLVWKQTIPGGWVWGSATVDDGLVYIPTVNGFAVCMDGKTGHIIWMYPTNKSIPAEPAIDGDIVYFGSWSRSLYAFDKKTGKILWKANGIGLDSGTLIAQDGKIYLPHHDNIFMYFNSKTGEILNGGNTNAEDKGQYSNYNASPAFHDGSGFFTARVGIGLRGIPLTSKVYSVDATTAKVNWTFPDGGGLSAPALASGRLYIGSGNLPFLYCLDQKTGEHLWTYEMGNRVEEATLCIYRDMLYVLSADGYIHAVK